MISLLIFGSIASLVFIGGICGMASRTKALPPPISKPWNN